jgi:hypothetical protein
VLGSRTSAPAPLDEAAVLHLGRHECVPGVAATSMSAIENAEMDDDRQSRLSGEAGDSRRHRRCRPKGQPRWRDSYGRHPEAWKRPRRSLLAQSASATESRGRGVMPTHEERDQPTEGFSDWL